MIAASFSYPKSEDELTTDLWTAGTLGILDDGASIRAYFDDSADLNWLRAKYDFVLERLVDASLQIHDVASEPVDIGERFVVTNGRPADLGESGREVLAVRARASFGSGKHETTQLVIEALESIDLRNLTVLDVGCGTAITSEAARRLGARMVVGCDTDTGAMESARENFPEIVLFQGSADAVASGSVDVAIVNITARIIDVLAAELCRVCRNGNSMLVLSGFVEGRQPGAFRTGKVRRRGDWECWISRPSDLIAVNVAAGPVQPFDREWW